MRIGIFGGTFNPPHLGHLHIVEDFCAQMEAIGKPLDKVLIIPTNVPPHKAAPELASNEDRLTMCRLTFETNFEMQKSDPTQHEQRNASDIQAGLRQNLQTEADSTQTEHSPGHTCPCILEVSDLETRREGPSYTYMTLRELHEQFDGEANTKSPEQPGESGSEQPDESGSEQPGAADTPADLYFLMGDDMLLYLNHWKYPDRILEDATLVSTIRSNACTVDELRQYAQTTFPQQYAQNRFLFFESDPFPVSSTEVRELVKIAAQSAAQQASGAGEPSEAIQSTGDLSPQIAREQLTHLLDPRVLAHILERGLYQ